MANKVIAALTALIGADTSGFDKGIKSVRSALEDTGRFMAGIGAMGFLVGAVGEAREAARGLRQLDAVLASTSTAVVQMRVDTGGYSEVLVKSTEKVKDSTGAHSKKVEVLKKVTIANSKVVEMEKATRESVLATSDALMKLTGIDDDVITGAQSILLTFTKIGKQVMPDATQATLDMAAALGLSNKEAAIQIGKALQSEQGVTALTRAGVTFTKAEQAKLKALFTTGRYMEAQKMILAELNREFGGSAAAQADGLTRLGTAWGNFVEGIGGMVLPVVDAAARVLTDLIYAAEPLTPIITGVAVAFAGLAATTGPIGAILGSILGPVGLVVGAVGALAVAWETNFGGIRDAITGAWASIKPGLDELKKNFDNFLQTLTGTAPASQQLNMRDLLTANLPEGDQNVLKALKFSMELTPEQRSKLTAEGKKVYDEVLSIAIPDTIPKPPPGLGERLGTALQDALPGLKKGFEDLLTGAKTWLETEGKGLIENGVKGAINFVDNAVTWVQSNAPKIKDGISAWLHSGINWLIDEAPGEFRGALSNALTLADNILQFIKDHAPDIMTGISQWATEALSWLASEDGGMGLLRSGLVSLFTLGEDISELVKKHAPDLAFGVGQWVRGALTWLTNDAPKLIAEAIGNLFKGGSSGPQNNSLSDQLRSQTSGIDQLLQPVANTITNIFTTAINSVAGLFAGLFGVQPGSGLKDIIDGFFGDTGPLKTGFNTAIKFIDDNFIKNGINKIGSAFQSVFSGIFNIIIDPIKKALKWFGEQILNIADSLGPLAGQARAIGAALVNFGGGAANSGGGTTAGGGGGGGTQGFHNANGGKNLSGWRMTGERGPEPAYFGSGGGRVIRNSRAQGIMGGSATLNVTVNNQTDGYTLMEQFIREAKRRNIVIEGLTS